MTKNNIARMVNVEKQQRRASMTGVEQSARRQLLRRQTGKILPSPAHGLITKSHQQLLTESFYE